jgi:hypothetical protein
MELLNKLNFSKRFNFPKNQWVEFGYNHWANKQWYIYKLTDGCMITFNGFKILVKY